MFVCSVVSLLLCDIKSSLATCTRLHVHVHTKLHVHVHACMYMYRHFVVQLFLQLGHGDTVKKTRPVQIAALADKSVVSIACGQYHSLALDDDHRWVWLCEGERKILWSNFMSSSSSECGAGVGGSTGSWGSRAWMISLYQLM